MSGQLRVSAVLSPKQKPWYKLNKMLGISTSALDSVQKILLPLPGIETRFRGCPAIHTTLTAFQLLSPKMNYLSSQFGFCTVRYLQYILNNL